MNLTLFIGSLYGGGAERVTCNLASWLAEHGHTVEILTMSETEEAYELSRKVTVQTLLKLSERKSSLYNAAIRIPRLARYLIKHREKDGYVVMLPKTILLLLALRHLTRAKIVVSERADPARYPKDIQKKLRRHIHEADGIVFQTKDAGIWYQELLQTVPSRVIPNAINPAFLRPAFEGQREKEIVAAGRLNNQKRYDLLIRSFAAIADQFPDYRLTIYGEGYNREKFEALVQELHMEDRISLPGNVSNIAEKLEKAALFVCCSDFEGMPNSLMEAMALGLPCVSTDCPVGGPRFLIQNGINGILTPVGEGKALSDAMALVLSNPELARKMSTNAAEVQTRLNPDTVYSQWERFILSCIEQ